MDCKIDEFNEVKVINETTDRKTYRFKLDDGDLTSSPQPSASVYCGTHILTVTRPGNLSSVTDDDTIDSISKTDIQKEYMDVTVNKVKAN